jgi:hypothetical protein
MGSGTGPPLKPPVRLRTNLKQGPLLSGQMRSVYFSVAPLLSKRAMGIGNESNQDNRAISTGKLNALPHLHTRPINVVVYHGSQGSTRFEVGFSLRCLQRLSRPYVATLHCGWRHNSSTRGMFIPVLSY